MDRFLPRTTPIQNQRQSVSSPTRLRGGLLWRVRFDLALRRAACVRASMQMPPAIAEYVHAHAYIYAIYLSIHP